MTRHANVESRMNLFGFSLAFAVTVALGSCVDEPSIAEPAEEWAVEAVARELAGEITFAVIGDYGMAGPNEQGVADLVNGWAPDFVLTVGDNNYPDGAQSTIDQNIGQYYQGFIYPYNGSYGGGSSVEGNRFFPSLGNHDTATGGGKAHLNYFTLPGNERYYDFVRGPVHFFAINSNLSETDGRSSGSKQALWLKTRLAQSTATWKIVYFHHPPYSSGNHGSTAIMQWPFQAWGATAVLAGHDHHYERIMKDGFPYMVNGLGGKSRYGLQAAVPGSMIRYNANDGAQLVVADDTTLTFKFIAKDGTIVDTYKLMAASAGADSKSFVNAEDTYIAGAYPTANYANASTIKLDGDVPTGTGHDYRGLVKWSVSAIPAGSTVTGVSINTYVENAAPGETYEIVEVLRPWNETSVTWNYPWAVPGGGGPGDTSSVLLGTMSSAANGPYTEILNEDGVEVVQGWVDDPSSNNGFMIYDVNNLDQIELYQSEHAIVAQRPVLMVSYIP